MTLLKSHEYQKSSWKNGLGETKQIAIFPKTATLEDNNYLWRLSSATVEVSSQFSIFKNCDRLLAIISGEGVVLNDTLLLLLGVTHFSGDKSTHCHLLKNSVVDLGLIYRRDYVSASMNIKTFSAEIEGHQVDFSEGTHILYCINGGFSVQEKNLAANDTLILEGPFLSHVTARSPSTYAYIRINQFATKPDFCKSVVT